MIKQLLKDITLAEQYVQMQRRHPLFTNKLLSDRVLSTGLIKPTSRSSSYKIEIVYKMREKPVVNVLQPKLVKNFNGDEIPHLWPGLSLCLYQPKYWEFKYSDFVADTIVPWTSLWLLYYENWHITGEWSGGGEH